MIWINVKKISIKNRQNPLICHSKHGTYHLFIVFRGYLKLMQIHAFISKSFATMLFNLLFWKVAGQSVSSNQSCDVIKMRDYPSLFLSLFSSHLLHFYDVTWLIFETIWPSTWKCLEMIWKCLVKTLVLKQLAPKKTL